MSMLDFVEFLSSDSDSDDNLHETKDNILANNVPEARNTVSRKNEEKKNEIVSLIRQLQVHIISLEKEKRSQLYNRNVQENVGYKELENVESNLSASRKKDYDQVTDSLQKVSLKIKQFQHGKKEVRKNPTYLEKLKILMEDIEADIMQMKEKQKLLYENLLMSEKDLSTQIEEFHSKLQQWSSNGISKNNQLLGEHAQKDKDVDVPKEVKEFEKFLQLTGGHQGGWDDIDHQTFLKLRRQKNGREQLISAAVQDIPTQSREDIIQHTEWYEEYSILKDRKRDAIRRWKSSKTNEREELLTNALNHQAMSVLKKQKKEELFEKERQERFEKLQEWKTKNQDTEEHQRRKEEEVKRERRALVIKQAMEEKKRLELKLQVEEYRQRKMEEEEILRTAKAEETHRNKPSLSSVELERIKERNEKIAINKQSQKLSKQLEETEKLKRLEKLKENVTVKVERDPSRLYQMTAGWKHRKESKDKSNEPMASGARAMPHRAVPTWRQGIT